MLEIVYAEEKLSLVRVKFLGKRQLGALKVKVKPYFQGEYLDHYFIPTKDGGGLLMVGTGEEDLTDVNIVKELIAKACKCMKELHVYEFQLDLMCFLKENPMSILVPCAEAMWLSTYEGVQYKAKQEVHKYKVTLGGIPTAALEVVSCYLREGEMLAKSVIFARKVVNQPGNHLRPLDFAREIKHFLKDVPVEFTLIKVDQLKEMGMGAMMAVGSSSAYPPCMVVLRYRGDENSDEITGLIGKGVTSDTGGYCLKPAKGMIGMKGDMAGGAAVAGAIYTLASQDVKKNITAVIPICENRLSRGSMLPGDVVKSYSGKTIEILNTDAEGRLILADAVSYAIKNEKITRVLDIATLTGAVVSTLGFSIAGAMCDNEKLWEEFLDASKASGEKFWRLPMGKEHEKMIESPLADIRNMGEGVCGTIVAGLFIRYFAENLPWIHLDIAGTAWVEKPIYEFQETYATGAGVETIYYWLKNKEVKEPVSTEKEVSLI